MWRQALRDLLDEWQALNPAMPMDPHDISLLEQSMDNLKPEHADVAKGWLDRIKEARFAAIHRSLERLEVLWSRFPIKDDNREMVDHR